MADKCLPSQISAEDISKLKVPDLKRELKQRGLSATGNKNELVERLHRAMKSTGTNSIDDIEEDLLNDDDDEHVDANESVINDLDKELSDSPKSEKRKHTEVAEDKVKGPKDQPAPKKVILNRNNSITATIVSQESTKTPEIEKEEEKNENADGKKVIKLSQLTAKERLEMRAKKFGTTVSNTDLVKAARAERFNLNTSTETLNSSADSIKSSSVNTSLDVLKQRAARFGVATSTLITDLEKQEKLEKRKQRFSGSGTTNGTTESEKAKARLERFKQSVK